MKSTGITRRIDDLGRIVIPKEIRKNLKIKENEVLEIFIDNDNIILKKFSSFDDMDKILESYIDVLSDISLKNVLITNRDKVIMCSENKKYDYLNKEISDDISYFMNNRKTISTKQEQSLEIIKNISITTNYLVNPIINNGDILGSIILFGNGKIVEKDIISTSIISKLIVNYID